MPNQLLDQMDAAERRGIGVTRLGDLTGLDVIGLPVWCATRPNSFGLSQTQGKGLTNAQAKISALMESAEHAHAERAYRLPGTTTARASDLGSRAIDPTEASTCQTAYYNPDAERTWCLGTELNSDSPRFAPFELVGLDFRVDAGWDRRTFQFSTVGLGAGASWSAAVLQGLLELIENDATLLVDALGAHGRLMTSIEIAEGRHAGLDAARARVTAAGCQVEFHALPHTSGLPVISATLWPAQDNANQGAIAGRYAGYACRLDPTEAALAALLEAVQSRLTDIAGVRDDIAPNTYPGHQDAAQSPNAKPEMGAPVDEVCPAIPLGGDPVRTALDRLGGMGVDQVLTFDLAPDTPHYHVARVFCPGLGQAAESGSADLGVHGIAALMKLAEGLK